MLFSQQSGGVRPASVTTVAATLASPYAPSMQVYASV